MSKKQISVPMAVSLDRSGRIRPEYIQWRGCYCRPKVRKIVRELPYVAGFVDTAIIEDMVEAEYIAIVEYGEMMAILEKGPKNLTASDWRALRNHQAVYLKFNKRVEELRRSLVLTPASKQNALLASQRSDALALMSEARARILKRADREKAIEATPVQ
jgi:hypothetical protein